MRLINASPHLYFALHLHRTLSNEISELGRDSENPAMEGMASIDSGGQAAMGFPIIRTHIPPGDEPSSFVSESSFSTTPANPSSPSRVDDLGPEPFAPRRRPRQSDQGEVQGGVRSYDSAGSSSPTYKRVGVGERGRGVSWAGA